MANREREYDNEQKKLQRQAKRDIADGYADFAPSADDLATRAACERDFRLFCESYFPEAFNLPWSQDHLRVIERIESAVLDGGLFALAMPRGSGKTTLCERAALWALLYGHRRFVAIVGPTETHAQRMLEHLKIELETNNYLARPFRAVCYPIRRLENNGRRAIGQLFHGEQTRIGWSASQLALPTMPGEACDGVNVSGHTVTVAGLTGSIRGQSHTLASGEVIRPELVLADDPQTRESARSTEQSRDRVAILNGDVLGMAGPGKKISVIIPCTVIANDDLADQMLDRDRNPQWQGERTKSVYEWPKNEKLWDEYAEIRANGLRDGDGGKAATEFYRSNRAEMDTGAVVAWPHRYDEDELSAIQHVMNRRMDMGEEAFLAEYQNEPWVADDEQKVLAVETVLIRLNHRERAEIPPSTVCTTGYIDVQDYALYYVVVAWQPDFTGAVVDYGTHPDQRVRSYSYRTIKHRLQDLYPGTGVAGSIQAGLERLIADLTGGRHRCDLVLVDSGHKPAIVAEACRKASSGSVMPSKGVGIRAGSKPMSSYTPKPGERHGHHWYEPAVGKTREVRHVRVDTNYWKAFVQDAFQIEPGDTGSLTLWGKSANQHQMFADHVAKAETWTQTEGHGRTVREYKLRASKPDNHLFDCLTGCAAAASMRGISTVDTPAEQPKRKRKRYDAAYFQKLREGR